MTEPTPEKKVKLSFSQNMQNMAFGMGTPIYVALTVWWYVGLCLYTWNKHKRLPGKPVTIMLFGSDPEQALDILKTYNLRYAYGSIQWAVLENQIGLLVYIMVSKASFDYVDNVLFQHSGASFEIITCAGSKRGQGIRKPYAQRQPSQPKRQAQASKAKLGKTYR